ncbi:MAG: AAA family ATPase [Rubrivivax sp.]|nr:AAA family ATPase [Rubrivivax sp.]
MPTDERQQLAAAISALEGQRALLGDAVVDAALGPMRERLARLDSVDAPPLPPPAPTSPGGQWRRQVSVLFLDVVGSAALAQRLDPEQFYELIDGLLRRCTEVVAAHGGRVLQYAGDNLLAVFGADGAREDDAERAVRAGLALVAEGSAFGQRVRRDHAHEGCHVRVGVHTGPVLLGGGVDDDGSIRGQAVNIAARMEQTAPAGGVRISHDTWMGVRGLFDVQVQPPIAVKGVDEPLATYLVQAAKPRSFRVPARGIDGVQARLIGREAEVAQLALLLDEVATGRRFVAATLIGPPGLGKSRLLAETQERLEAQASRWWLFLGRADAQQRLQPYGVLRDLLAWRLSIPDSDTGSAARQRLVDGLMPWLGEQAETRAECIGQLIGMDFSHSAHVAGLSPRQLREQAFAALVHYLHVLAAEGSAVAMLIEDLHWADDGTLDFLEHLAAQATALPLALLATARPDLLERRPEWGTRAAGQRLLRLGDLRADDAQALAAALLERAGDEGRALAATIVQRSGGNPFFIEELVRMCIDLGVLVPDAGANGDRWRVQPERLDLERLPTTLVGVLQARLDSLTPTQRMALQQASIVGSVFWDDALGTMDAAAPAQVEALQQRELVHRQPQSAFDDTLEAAFHHQLMQQVTYDTVLRPMRRTGHAATARWLAERVGDRSAEYLAITAEHYDRAGDAEHALQYFQRAAADARRRYANDAAYEYLRRALANPLAADPRVRERLLASLQSLADATGQRQLQEDTIRQRRANQQALDDPHAEASLLMDEALLHSRRGDDEAAYGLAMQVVAMEERLGATQSTSTAHGQVAWSLYRRGDLEGAERHAQASIALGHALGREPGNERLAASLAARGLTMRLVLAEARGDIVQGLAIGDEILALTEHHGLRREQAQVLISRSIALQHVGRWRDALEGFETALTVAGEIGLAMTVATAHYNIAICWYMLGDADRALLSMDRAEAGFVVVEEQSLVARSRWFRARVAIDRGQFDEADRWLADAMATYTALGLQAWVVQCLGWQAEVALRRGDLARAAVLVEQSREQRLEGGVMTEVDEPHHPDWIAARVWRALGDPRGAAQLRDLRDRLLAEAQRIADPELRRGLLEDVPINREILAAAAAQPTPA